jgi:type IV pilus assembly protein PilA
MKEHRRGIMNIKRDISAQHQQHEAGFTLIELLIVMSVMLILMTLAVPQMLKLKKQANETSAAQSVRTIANAELQSKSGAPSPQAAQLVAPDLAGGQKAGYTFAITNCNKVTVNNQDMYTSFEITAVPQAVGKTGDNGYCADENNTIRKDPAGGSNCTLPLQ